MHFADALFSLSGLREKDMVSHTLPMAVVVRETGVTADVLRKWEIRYGFPQPVRSPTGARRYPLGQVGLLLQIKRLINSGVRAGDAIRQAVSGGIPEKETPTGSSPHPDTVEAGLDAVRTHELPGLRAILDQAVASLGVKGFIETVATPLSIAVGDAWLNGDLRVYEEHLFSATLSDFLAELHRRFHQPNGKPRVLLTTAPGELHTLGLEMVRVLFAEAQANCIYLGAQTPITDMAAALTASQAEILALYFSAAYPGKQLLSTLEELRGLVPSEIPIWVGGAGTYIATQLPAGIKGFVSASDAIAALR